MAFDTALSIGALAQSCGIPASTLRTWERRYGRPAPVRGSGGQRVYGREDLDHLKLVAEALSRGHRAGQVVPAETEDLRALLGMASRETGTDSVLPALLAAVSALDGEALDRYLRSAWGRHSAQDFLDRIATPFLRELGEAWADGRIGVFQEHYGSERLRSFLEEVWRPLARGSTGSTLVLACLAGERHSLGLHLVAVVTVLAGFRPVFLGADVPAVDLVASVKRTGARGLLVSFAAGSPASDRVMVKSLRDQLPSSTVLVVGGAGAPEVEGVRKVEGLNDLSTWLAAGMP